MTDHYRLPELQPHVIAFARELGGSWLGWVPVVPKPHCREWDCHNNTLRYVDWYGGVRIIGYYLLHDVSRNRLGAILHSIVQRENRDLIDITPFDDERPYNLFCVLRQQTPNYSQQEVWCDYHAV